MKLFSYEEFFACNNIRAGDNFSYIDDMWSEENEKPICHSVI